MSGGDRLPQSSTMSCKPIFGKNQKIVVTTNLYLEEPFMSKYEVDGGFADGECKIPLLMVVPELGVDKV